MERAAIEGEEARGVSLLLERRHEAHEVFEGLTVLLRGALALQAPASRLLDVQDFSSAFRLSAISNFNIWKIETTSISSDCGLIHLTMRIPWFR